MKELFRTLADAPGLSGHEETVRSRFRQAVEDLVDRIEVDRLGNLLASKSGRAPDGPRLMLHAHLDEIGMLVSAIEESGIVRFVKIGAFDDRMLPNRLVTIHTRGGPLPGLIGRPAPGRLTAAERGQPYPWGKLFVDVGAFSGQEVRERGVRVGDPITFENHFRLFGDRLVVSKACDDRLGLAVLVEVLRRLAEQDHAATIIIAALSQHEVGLKGAATAARGAAPDIDIHVDVTGNFPDDPGAAAAMGGGPVIRLLEGFGAGAPFAAQRGVFCSRPVVDLLIDTAEGEDLPYQLQIKPGIINDPVEIQPVGQGVHVGYVLIPTRYVHSPHEMVLWDDVEETVRLLTAFCRRVDSDFLAAADQLR